MLRYELFKQAKINGALGVGVRPVFLQGRLWILVLENHYSGLVHIATTVKKNMHAGRSTDGGTWGSVISFTFAYVQKSMKNKLNLIRKHGNRFETFRKVQFCGRFGLKQIFVYHHYSSSTVGWILNNKRMTNATIWYFLGIFNETTSGSG